MNTLPDYFGLLGCLLVLVATPLIIVRRPRHSRKTVTIFIFLMVGLAILPVDGLPLLVYTRALLADLSITSITLLCVMISSSYTGQQYIKTQTRHQLNRYLLIGAVILYPLGLGLTPYDSYALGYGSITLYGLLLFFAIYLLWRQAFLVLSLLLVAITAYLLNVLQSDNLWDYLIDPWIVIVVVTGEIKTLVTYIRGRIVAQ